MTEYADVGRLRTRCCPPATTATPRATSRSAPAMTDPCRSPASPDQTCACHYSTILYNSQNLHDQRHPAFTAPSNESPGINRKKAGEYKVRRGKSWDDEAECPGCRSGMLRCRMRASHAVADPGTDNATSLVLRSAESHARAGRAAAEPDFPGLVSLCGDPRPYWAWPALPRGLRHSRTDRPGQGVRQPLFHRQPLYLRMGGGNQRRPDPDPMP